MVQSPDPVVSTVVDFYSVPSKPPRSFIGDVAVGAIIDSAANNGYYGLGYGYNGYYGPGYGYPAEPLVSYQINRQLSGWNLPPLVIRAFGAHCQAPTLPSHPLESVP